VDFVKKTPWLSLSAALATGYVLGRIAASVTGQGHAGHEKVVHLPGWAGQADLERGSIFFVGTATTIISYGGLSILTDPNFLHAGDHAHLGYGITSARRTDPAIEVEQLPPLDLCLLSHMHGDHWDHIAAAHLRKDLPIVTTRHAAASLRKQGFYNPQSLDTWQSIVITKGEVWLRITAMPGTHGPGPLGALLPPVMGSMLEWGSGDEPPRFRLYISGDTLVGKHLHGIPRRFPNVDLAMLHLGGTQLFGILLTMDAKQGLQAIRIIQPRAVLPIHYNDYTVFKSPVEDFLHAVEASGLDVDLHYLRHGESFTFRVPTPITSS
jgi:L-ascorbate metabolism protein UlaG (beta-lactamase superfamily)